MGRNDISGETEQQIENEKQLLYILKFSIAIGRYRLAEANLSRFLFYKWYLPGYFQILCHDKGIFFYHPISHIMS